MTTKTSLNDTWTEVADIGQEFAITVISTTWADIRYEESTPAADAKGHPLRQGQWLDKKLAGLKVFARSAITGQTAVIVVSKDAV